MKFPIIRGSEWHRDKHVPYCYWRGEEMIRAIRKPFGFGTYTIMHRKKMGEQPTYFEVFTTIKQANKGIRKWIKERR